MTDEIDALKAIFTAKPRPITWSERRDRMNEICAIDPPTPGIAFTPITIDGTMAEWSLAPESDASRVLLYFHGGGYCAGSIVSHRSLVGNIGQDAGLRTLAIEYRLAPEHRKRSPEAVQAGSGCQGMRSSI